MTESDRISYLGTKPVQLVSWDAFQTSQELDQLGAALAEVQARAGGMKKSGKNPHLGNTYHRLDDAWEVLRPLLAEHKVAVLQMPVVRPGQAGCWTQVIAGGQWVRGLLLLEWSPQRGLNPAQAAGSAISYARRYALLAVCGLAGDDDDGCASSAPRGAVPDRERQEARKQRQDAPRAPAAKPTQPTPPTILDEIKAQARRGSPELRAWVDDQIQDASTTDQLTALLRQVRRYADEEEAERMGTDDPLREEPIRGAR